MTEFTTAILEEVGVALVTGAGFVRQRMSCLSYATDMDTLKEACSSYQGVYGELKTIDHFSLYAKNL